MPSKPNWTLIAGFITVGVTVVISAITATSVVDSRIAATDTRVTKLEDAAKALGDEQAEPIKTIIHDLLAAAVESLPDKPEIAEKATSVAGSLLARLKNEKKTSDPQYFQTTLAAIDDVSKRIPSTGHARLSEAVYTTRVALAEYRSALEPPPQNIGTWITPDLAGNTEAVFRFAGQGLGLDGGNFDLSKAGNAPLVKLIPPQKGLLSENHYVTNAAIKNGVAVLDGIRWTNVTFIGTHIIYQGGEMELRNVLFVGCTFELVPTTHGQELAEYATLGNQHLVVQD